MQVLKLVAPPRPLGVCQASDGRTLCSLSYSLQTLPPGSSKYPCPNAKRSACGKLRTFRRRTASPDLVPQRPSSHRSGRFYPQAPYRVQRRLSSAARSSRPPVPHALRRRRPSSSDSACGCASAVAHLGLVLPGMKYGEPADHHSHTIQINYFHFVLFRDRGSSCYWCQC